MRVRSRRGATTSQSRARCTRPALRLPASAPTLRLPAALRLADAVICSQQPVGRPAVISRRALELRAVKRCRSCRHHPPWSQPDAALSMPLHACRRSAAARRSSCERWGSSTLCATCARLERAAGDQQRRADAHKLSSGGSSGGLVSGGLVVSSLVRRLSDSSDSVSNALSLRSARTV